MSSNNCIEIEKKYIAERVAILKELQKLYGADIIKIAVEEKKKLEIDRVKRKYDDKLPISLDEYYHYAFEDFENINQYLSSKIVEKNKNYLTIEVDKCLYCNIYNELNAKAIGMAMVCQMDKVITEAMNPDFTLTRHKCKMNGDDVCEFRIERRNKLE